MRGAGESLRLIPENVWVGRAATSRRDWLRGFTARIKALINCSSATDTARPWAVDVITIVI
jgi:hypothetical protein